MKNRNRNTLAAAALALASAALATAPFAALPCRAATVDVTPAYATSNTAAGDTAAMTNISEWAASVTAAIASGGGSSESYPGTCRVTFTLGGELPTGDVAEEMLEAAYVVLKVDNSVFRYPLTSFAEGTQIATLVSVSPERAARAYVSFECPTVVSEQYLFTTKYLTLRSGTEYAVPVILRKADADLFAIGRGQRIDDTATMSSFLFTRDCASTNGYAPVTLFGYYHVSPSNTVWVNETGVTDGHPTIADGVITGSQGDFETRIFPWAQAEKRVVYANFSDSSYGNDYHFTWIPLYYWRLEDVTLPVRTYTEATDTWTTNSVAFRIHWISKSKLPGFDLPPWAYVHAYDATTGTWGTVGVKDGFYYARYDSVTMNGKARSKAFAAMDTGYTRHDITTYCHALNAYSCTVSGPTATNLAYAIDGSNRLWAPPMYENYAPFRELAYIQFGASMKSVFYGGSRTNTDSLETAFETAGDAVKSFATGSGTAANFAWLYIWNPFYGCEGAVMADAAYVAGRDEDGNEYAEWWVCPDRAADVGGATTTDALAAAGGFPLAYRYKGAGLTSKEQARCIDETSAQSAIYWFPGHAAAKCAVRVTDESGWYGGAPSADNPGTNKVYGNWLSLYRGIASRLGLWYVHAVADPSFASADNWGARPSFAPVRATGEAQSAP